MFANYPAELVRYIINGIVATVAHYATLSFNLEVLHFSSAGVANLIAAVVGISTSFIGNRYYVFRVKMGSIVPQALKFWMLYSAIALLHGFVLLIWTDMFGLNYSVGFLIATFFQVSLSYVGNKLLVFK